MSRKFTNEFRNNAVEYCLSHPELSHKAESDKRGINTASLYNWINTYKSNDNNVELRGSGNFASKEAK